MTATLTVLGAGSILPRSGYGCAGYALRPGPGEPVTLLDCGPGSIRALAPAGVALAEVRRVVFSHYHLDHCLDLLALFFARRNPRFDPPPPLELCGPAGLATIVARAPDAFSRWASDPEARVHEVVLDAQGRGGFEREGLAFSCAKNAHNPESVSWRVERVGRFSLAYTGDTNEDPRVAELARGVELLVAECSFPDAEGVEGHLTPSSAARLARAAGCQRLLLSHFYPSCDPAAAVEAARRVFDGPIEAARDGSVHGIGGTR
jgi:ribonuclease BN (tRNA processing enzyme)